MERIKISVKGLAKFMTATPSRQRKILKEFKFPNDDEPRAMRLYYGEAVDAIKAYHKNNKDRQWLLDQADLCADLAGSLGGQSATRLRNNARALKQYADNFYRRKFEILSDVKLAINHSDVRVSVVPDLHVREGTKEKIIKLDFAREPDGEQAKIISQCMFEAFRQSHGPITPAAVLYLHVTSGQEIRGARAGSRLMSDFKAACENISALWDTITR
jgi:hypothetical protein